MAIELEQRRDITLEAARRVAWAGEGIVIAQAAYDVMAASRAAFLRFLEVEDVVVYGVTSGYGFGAGTPLSAEARIIPNPAVGLGSEGFTEESEVVRLVCHDSRRGETWHGLQPI